MIERIIELSIRYRFAVIGAAGLVALAGLVAVYHTPVDAIPDLSENQVIVFTDWPGHSPREMEDQVGYPLTLQLQGLAGVRVVRSSSDFNFSMISVIFDDAIDLRAARQQLSERLTGAAAELPAGVTPRLAPDAAATGQIYWYTVEGGGLDLGRLRAVQDWYVKPQLSAVPGVAEVASVGGFPVEYHVEVDPLKLQALGVRLDDVLVAVARSNQAVGGNVVHKGNAEYIVRGVGWLGAAEGEPDAARVVRELEGVPVRAANGSLLRVSDVAAVTLGAPLRRGALEKDGNEVTGGVVLMRQGENPLEVTRRLKQKIEELQAGLPAGVRIVPFYDRTPLIEGAVHTLTATLLEAMLTATLCVLLVLRHFRTSFVIVLTLPLSVLASFGMLWLLRRAGLADVQTNIMSLAGIAISIGILVDSSVVMAENAMHHLKEHFGDRPVRGDVRAWVLPACRTVGRPIFFSVLIMLLSFLPVFALGGMEGKMFRPLAITKSLALVAVAVLAITLVPALCTLFIKGRLRGEEENWLVRNVIQAYRPALNYLLDRPGVLVWVIAVTFLVGLAPLGDRRVLLGTLTLGVLALAWIVPRWQTLSQSAASLVVIALAAEQLIQPLGREFMTPLDEGMVMDMPISVPRASIAQSVDDLKARDMVFCRFPEVDMVVGKAGRAETPTDPAPLDMIETMINFRPAEFWPKRKLRRAAAESHAERVLAELQQRQLIAPVEPASRHALIDDVVEEALATFDAQMREYAYQRNKEFERELGGMMLAATVDEMGRLLYENGSLRQPFADADRALVLSHLPHRHAQHLSMAPELEDITLLAREIGRHLTELGFLAGDQDPLHYRPNTLLRWGIAAHAALGGEVPTFFTRLHGAVQQRYRGLWYEHLARLNPELRERAGVLYTRLALEAILDRSTVADSRIVATLQELKRRRLQAPAGHVHGPGHHHGDVLPPLLDPLPELDALRRQLARSFASGLLLWRKDRSDLIGFGSEPDRVMQMPGWTNVWTMPIQNRVDMLATGVNSTVGIRVLGRELDAVVRASETVAAAMRQVPGAADVVADPVRGKGYAEVRPDREKAARFGLTVADVNDVIETAVGGKVVTTTVEGRERHPVRVRFPRAWREDDDSIRNLFVTLPGLGKGGVLRQVPLTDVADVAVVEGPATIKSENALLRNYVRLNVRGRDAAEFVEEARRLVATNVRLPAGVFLEWTGQFEHEVQARQLLSVLWPLVVALIFLILYFTYHDLADALLMLCAVPGALAGGVFFQWLFGYKFSVTVWVGYIACFGMATSTGIVMLVYLREAVARLGNLAEVSLEEVRQAVLRGAVQRLRPKLLTEGTTIIGLAPLLWATGTGAEVIKPMVVPVLGGILIADEVIDLFLPVLFYWVRRRRWQRAQPALDSDTPSWKNKTLER